MMLLLAVLVTYLLGSVPFGAILARLHGVDLRRMGSGNIGATNAARALGKGWGGVVLLLDAAKAAVPVLVWARVFGDHPQRGWLLAMVGAAAVCGHVFSVFLGFHGGKGVATTFGAFLVLEPLAALLGLLTYGLAYGVSRISSVGSLSALLLFPLWLSLCHAPAPAWALAGFALALIGYRHTGNIRRLLRRQETRI